MFAAKDRPLRNAEDSRRPVTLAAFLLATSSEFPTADSTPVPRVWSVLVARASNGPTLGAAEAKPLRTGKHSALLVVRARAVLAACPRNPSRTNTYAKCAANPRKLRTYKIIGLKVSYNEHLRKNGGGGGLIVTQPPPSSERAGAGNKSRQCDPLQHVIRT